VNTENWPGQAFYMQMRCMEVHMQPYHREEENGRGGKNISFKTSPFYSIGVKR